jgi:hypothetical protein
LNHQAELDEPVYCGFAMPETAGNMLFGVVLRISCRGSARSRAASALDTEIVMMGKIETGWEGAEKDRKAMEDVDPMAPICLANPLATY